MRTEYTTSKNTVLPILNLKGKEYLEVKWRLVWFRENHPDWSIETEFIERTLESAFCKAIVKDETGRIIATAHKGEDIEGFRDFSEKCETSAVGRALAMIGYGTQFCADELDEGERLADSPVDKGPKSWAHPANNPAKQWEKAKEEAKTVTTLQQSTSPIIKMMVPTPIEMPEAPPLESYAENMGPPPAEVEIRNELSNYTIMFGKFKGKSLRQIPKDDIMGYIAWMKNKSKTDGKPVSKQTKDLEMAAEAFWADRIPF